MSQNEYSGRDNLDVMSHAHNYNHYLLSLILAGARPQDRLVDFGAGKGTFALSVAAAGLNVVCVERDLILQASLIEHGLKVVDDLNQLPDGSVDYLYSFNVLEHIDDDLGIAQLWFRKLRPGGQLLVFVPAFQYLYTSMDRQVGHFRRYTRGSLAGLLKKAQFDIGMSSYVDSLGIVATLLYKALDQGSGTVSLSMLKIYDRWIFPLSRLIDCVIAPLGGKNVLIRAYKPSL